MDAGISFLVGKVRIWIFAVDLDAGGQSYQREVKARLTAEGKAADLERKLRELEANTKTSSEALVNVAKAHEAACDAVMQKAQAKERRASELVAAVAKSGRIPGTEDN